MKKHTSTFSTDPIVGQIVAGFSDGPWYHSTWSGLYDGVRVSEHSGELVHFFHHGEINGIKQRCFATPVSQFTN